MIGQVIGAPTTVATRRSVILSCDGIDLGLTFWTVASRSRGASQPMAEAPAAAAPADLKNVRRSR
jgi:hypothetical protein